MGKISTHIFFAVVPQHLVHCTPKLPGNGQFLMPFSYSKPSLVFQARQHRPLSRSWFRVNVYYSFTLLYESSFDIWSRVRKQSHIQVYDLVPYVIACMFVVGHTTGNPECKSAWYTARGGGGGPIIKNKISYHNGKVPSYRTMACLELWIPEHTHINTHIHTHSTLCAIS